MSSSSGQKNTGMVRRTERGTRIAAAVIGAVLTIFVGHLALMRAGKSLVTASYDIPFVVHRPETQDQIRIVYMDQLDGEALDRRRKASVNPLSFRLPSWNPEAFLTRTLPTVALLLGPTNSACELAPTEPRRT